MLFVIFFILINRRKHSKIEEILSDKNPSTAFMCSVGVKDGRVADEDMTASSSWDANHGPQYGRLYNQVSFSKPSYMGAWAAGAGKLGQGTICLRLGPFGKHVPDFLMNSTQKNKGML